MGGGSENESRTSGIGPFYKKRKTTNSVVANTVDPSPFQFKWTIYRFSKKNEKNLYSDVFEVGGYKWRVLIYPKGGAVMGYLSMYLELLDSASLPNGWSVNAQISMTIVNQITNKNSVRGDMQLQFKEQLSSWGFASFIPLGELYDHYKGFLVNDTLVVEVSCSVAEKDIAEHLTKRLKREQEDKNKKNKEKAEAHLYTIIKVVRDEDLAEQIGRDIYFDLVDPDKVRSFRVSKKMTIKDFKKMLAKEFGIPARSQRLWYWSRRQNHTYRPSRPMEPSFEAAGHVGQFVNFPRGGLVELVLFLEVERGRDLRPIPLLKKRWGDILLFFKLYDPEKEELRYVGSLIVNWRNEKPSEILARLNKLADYEPDEEIKLYKEIAFEPNVICEHVDKKLTFEENKLENGGIICFQKVSAMDNVKHIRHPDVPSYLEYVHNGQVPLSPSDKESKDEESVEEQNENITDEQTNVDENIDAQQSKEDIETTYDDEGTSKSNTSKLVSIELEEIDAMIDDDVIAAIDKVLSEGINISLKSQHSVQGQVSKLDPNLPEQLLQELRDITFKEDLVEKIKKGLIPIVIFKAVIDKINANASAFSSHQLEQVGVVVNLLNNIVRMLEKLHFLKKELDSAKKSTDQDNEALKLKRQKILTLKTSVTDQQTQLNSLDVEIADLEAKLKKRQADRAKIAEIQDQKKDKITSLNKEVKSIFHRLADDQIKLKSVEDQIPKAQTELESHEKLYRIFKMKNITGSMGGSSENKKRKTTKSVEVELTWNVEEKDTAEYLRKRLKKEQEEEKHKNEASTEDLLYTLKVVRDEDLAEQIGKDIYFDLVDPDKVRSFQVLKKTTFKDFKKELVKEYGIPARSQRFWYWKRCENHTYRPIRPMEPNQEKEPVGRIVNFPKDGVVELVLFLEVERGPDLRPIPLVKKTQSNILLFFKLYDPEKEELRYVGRLTVNCSDDKPSEILTTLNKLAGYDPDEVIELYEEIEFEPNVKCQPVDKKLTFEESKLKNGAIICFQKASAMDNVKHIRYPDVPSYLEYVHNGRVYFPPTHKESKDEESLEEQNKNIIAEETNVDKNIEAQHSKGGIETFHDEGTNKSNTSKLVSIDSEEFDAMVDEDVISAIDKVLSKGITLSLKPQHPVQGQEVSKLDPNLPEQLLQELRDIAFKGDLVEKFKEGLTPKVNFNVVKEKIDANAGAFSSLQLEQVGAVVSLLNNIVRMLEKLENLRKEQDLAEKGTDQYNEALKETRQKILTSKASFTNHQTQLNSLDAQIAKLQEDRARIAEIQDQEKDKIMSYNNEVKSTFQRLVDDQMKLEGVKDQISEAQSDLESYERFFQIFKAIPPF